MHMKEGMEYRGYPKYVGCFFILLEFAILSREALVDVAIMKLPLQNKGEQIGEGGIV